MGRPRQIFSDFWTGATGRQIYDAGGHAAQVLALYVCTNRHANMLGLYRLLEHDVHYESRIKPAALDRAWRVLETTSFASYDPASAYVWVRQMARFQLNIRPGDALEPADNRVIAANRVYAALDDNPFLGPFFDQNAGLLLLRRRRASLSPFEAPCKPGKGSGSGSGSGIGIRDQDQVQERTRADAQTSRNLIRALARTVIRDHPGEPFTDLRELVKSACAKEHISYNADAVGSALEQAIAQLTKRQGARS